MHEDDDKRWGHLEGEHHACASCREVKSAGIRILHPSKIAPLHVSARKYPDQHE